MHARSALRRGLAGLGAALLAGAALAGTPAHAAEDSQFFASFQDMTMGADGSPGKAGIVSIFLNAVQNPVLTIDSAGLAGVATVETPPGCSANGTTVTCTFPSGVDLEADLPLVLHPAPGSKAGDSGTLKLSTSGDNIPTQSGNGGTVTLADGIDMVVLNPNVHTEVHPDDALPLQVDFANGGNRTADGIRVSFHFDYGVVPAEIFDNCSYSPSPDGGRNAVCDLDTTAAPGAAFTTTYPVRITKDVPQFLGVDEFVQGLAEQPLPMAAKARKAAQTGHKLKSTPRSATATPKALPPDIDNGDNFGFANLDVVNWHDDLAAVGATASGGEGDTVKVAVGARNNGPGALDSARSREAAFVFVFIVPPGTTTVVVPQVCAAVIPEGDQQRVVWGKTGEKYYRCFPNKFLVVPGQTVTLTFSLRIDTVISSATGKSTLDDKYADPTVHADDNPADNAADVVINPPGGTGGGLPVTGAPVALLATGGALVVLAGAVLLILARRRRTAA